MPEPVAGDAVERRDQRAEILQRAEHREPEHRSGLDQHVPAEDDRLHLERPRGEQIGGPLEAEAADPRTARASTKRACRAAQAVAAAVSSLWREVPVRSSISNAGRRLVGAGLSGGP